MRQNSPGRVFRTLAATALATGLCVPLVKAQAAGEYTLAFPSRRRALWDSAIQ